MVAGSGVVGMRESGGEDGRGVFWDEERLPIRTLSETLRRNHFQNPS